MICTLLKRSVVCTLCLLLASAPSAWAGQKGQFRGTAVLVNVEFQQMKALEGHPGGPQMIGEMDGLIFNDNQQPFLQKARYQVIWKGDAAGGSCFKTFTMPDGKVFARCEGKPTPTGNEGSVWLMGGTGAYSGIKGTGIFKLTNVADRVMWDILEWDYEIP